MTADPSLTSVGKPIEHLNDVLLSLCENARTKHANCCSDRSSLCRFCLGLLVGIINVINAQAHNQQLHCSQKCLQLQHLLVCDQTGPMLVFSRQTRLFSARHRAAVVEKSYQYQAVQATTSLCTAATKPYMACDVFFPLASLAVHASKIVGNTA